MSVDLSLLRVLVMVMDERNVTRAAERLHQSQPSVSIALRRLREHFDDPLFLPLRRGVVPTPRAIELAHRATKILRDVEEMTQAERFDPATEETTVFIAANDFGVLSVIAPLVEGLRTKAPGIRLQVRRLASDISRQLDRQEVDMAVTILTEPGRPAHVQPLFREAFSVAVGVGHELAGKELTLDDFCSCPHVRVAWADTNVTDPVDNALSDLGRQRNAVLTVPSYFYLPRMLANSNLIAVAPCGVISHFERELVALPMPVPIPGFSMNLIWDDRTHTSARHMWVREQILAHCAGDPDS